MNLLILNYEYPPLGGGAGLCTRYQAEGLAACGHSVTVITTWYEGEPEIEERNRLKLIRLKSRRIKSYQSDPVEMLSWAWKTIHHIRRNRLYLETDLVLAHFTIPGGLVALPAKLLYKIPYYIVSHGQDIPWFCPKEMFLFHLVFYFPIRWICSRASKITVLSHQRLNDLNRITGRSQRGKNHVVPNGCDVGFFTPAEADKETQPFRILFTGRLRRQKDPLTMLKAVRIFRKYEIPFLVEVAGDGPLRRKMERYVSTHDLEEVVRFHGWVSREALREKYRDAHLLLITSRDEGMSLAMMEALASGLYILTTRVSGSESLIREDLNGDFIPSGNPGKIAGHLEDIYRNKIRKKYRVPDHLLHEIRESISWDQYVKAYERLIQI